MRRRLEFDRTRPRSDILARVAVGGIVAIIAFILMWGLYVNSPDRTDTCVSYKLSSRGHRKCVCYSSEACTNYLDVR